jgi:hypothetical protein
MIRVEERRQMALGIEEAQACDARLDRACAIVGIDVRTLQRCKAGRRPTVCCTVAAVRRPSPAPAHALGEQERAQIVAVAKEVRFAELPPARIVPMPAFLPRFTRIKRSGNRQGDQANRDHS